MTRKRHTFPHHIVKSVSWHKTLVTSVTLVKSVHWHKIIQGRLLSYFFTLLFIFTRLPFLIVVFVSRACAWNLYFSFVDVCVAVHRYVFVSNPRKFRYVFISRLRVKQGRKRLHLCTLCTPWNWRKKVKSIEILRVFEIFKDFWHFCTPWTGMHPLRFYEPHAPVPAPRDIPRTPFKR